MKKLFLAIFCAIIVLGGIGVYWSATHYVVQTKQGYLVVPKRFITLKNTFIDIRHWREEDFDNHRSLEDILREEGYESLVEDRESVPEKKETENKEKESSETPREQQSDSMAEEADNGTSVFERAKDKGRNAADAVRKWIADLATEWQNDDKSGETEEPTSDEKSEKEDPSTAPSE